MKKFKKLIPALALLLVSAVLMSTASYAWFSMNNKVTVTGMEVRTKVSSNLLIAGDSLASTARQAEANFTAAPLTQEVKAILEPVSTVDGKSFFYTREANANGAIASGAEWVAYDPNAAKSDGYYSAFSQYYGITTSSANEIFSSATPAGAEPYADYVFQLKAVNTEAGTVDLKLTQLDLTYIGATDENKAYRVAVFVEDITSDAPDGKVGDLKAIYAPDGAANQVSSQAVNGASSRTTLPTNETKLAEVATNTTKYYKVVVRLWLEGEDTTCTNDRYAALNNSWKLTIAITLGTEETNVTNLTINSSAT